MDKRTVLIFQEDQGEHLQSRRTAFGYPRAEFVLHSLDFSSEYWPGKHGICLSMAPAVSVWCSLNADLKFY